MALVVVPRPHLFLGLPEADQTKANLDATDPASFEKKGRNKFHLALLGTVLRDKAAAGQSALCVPERWSFQSIFVDLRWDVCSFANPGYGPNLYPAFCILLPAPLPSGQATKANGDQSVQETCDEVCR